MLAQKPEALRPIAAKWFEAIKNIDPDVEAFFHDNYPIGCIEDAPFANVNMYTTHVNAAFYYGAYSPDPRGILEGTGKNMRHAKIRPNEACNEKAFSNLISSAFKDIIHRLNYGTLAKTSDLSRGLNCIIPGNKY